MNYYYYYYVNFVSRWIMGVQIVQLFYTCYFLCSTRTSPPLKTIDLLFLNKRMLTSPPQPGHRMFMVPYTNRSCCVRYISRYIWRRQLIWVKWTKFQIRVITSTGNVIAGAGFQLEISFSIFSNLIWIHNH